MKEKIIAILSDLRPEFDFTDESLNFIEEGMLDSFDVVCLVDALDTEFNIVIDGIDILPENFSTIESIEALLKKNGVIFLQIPSSDSLAAKVLQEKCNMFDGLEHVNIYGVKTITKLAQKCGLEVLDIKSVISEIGVINNYLSYENPYLGNTTNKAFIPNLIDEKTLHEKLLGYKLQVVLGVKA